MKKKRRRRYRLVWPFKKTKYQVRKMRRLRIRKKAIPYIIGIAVSIIFIFLVIFIPKYQTQKKLKELGYSKASITAIKEQNLSKTIIEHQYYSKYLSICLQNKNVNTDFLPLYTVCTEERPATEYEFLLYRRLLEKGYEEDDILTIFQNLKNFEITPLLVFDTQADLSVYIADCESHRDTNNENRFILSNSYVKPYASVSEVTKNGIDMLVNKSHHLSSEYVPEELTTLSSMYSAPEKQLAKIAAEAVKNLCDAGRQVGVTFYVIGAYRPYETQDKVYNDILKTQGEDVANTKTVKAGYSEHQTGYAIDITASHEDDIPEFKNTLAFQWTSSNSYSYGWILRYPEEKVAITGFQYEPWHYRYVGVDLAKKIIDSKLTFDEYWCLYLKPWTQESNRPSDTILQATGATGEVIQQASDSNEKTAS